MKRWILFELFVALAILFIVFGVFRKDFGLVATPAHAPNPDDLMEISALNRVMDDEFVFPQNVCITFTTQEKPRNKSLPIYSLFHDLRYSPTAGLYIILTGPNESGFDNVINRIRNIVETQSIKTFKVRRTDGKFFREEVVFLKCDFGNLQQKGWIQMWKKVFMEYPRFFYDINVDTIKTLKLPLKLIRFKNVLTAQAEGIFFCDIFILRI